MNVRFNWLKLGIFLNILFLLFSQALCFSHAENALATTNGGIAITKASEYSTLNSAILPADGKVTYWGVITGVSDYPDSKDDLNYCDDDAQDLYDTLVADYHWNSSSIQLLKDSQATKSGIKSAIDGFLSDGVDADDIFLFFFSGHGGNCPDQPPIDESDEQDEYICPYDTNILDDELQEWLNVGLSGCIVILDTCHSGGFIKSEKGVTKGMFIPGVSKRVVLKGDGFVKDLNSISNLVVLTACDDDETCIDSGRLENGLFTYYVVKGLEHYDTDSNGDDEISAEEDYDYAAPVVTSISTKLSESNPKIQPQHPQLSDNYPGQLTLVDAPPLHTLDLTIASISLDTAFVDEETNIVVTITNQGTQDVTKDFWVDVYYDPASPPDKGEWGDSYQEVTQTVPAGESIKVTFTHTFNSAGDHIVWAQVDSDDLVSETDEDNNISGPHTITINQLDIDFTITSISPDAAQVDEEVNIIVVVANQGTQDVTEDFWVDVYYDPVSSPTKGQTGDSFQKVTQTIKAEGSIEVTFTHTFSSTGDHTVWAQVDTNDSVSETDKDNNISGPHTITISAAPTPILEVDPTSLAFGEIEVPQTETKTSRVYNSGTGTLSGTISDDRDWMTVDPTSFESNGITISVTIDTSIMAEMWKEYTGTVTVSSNGGTRTVDVSVTPTCVRAFPNPFNPRRGKLTFWGTGVPHATIRIYTLSGELIKTLYEETGSDKIYWDGRNEEGKVVANGTYLYLTVTSQEKNVGRFVVIKR